MAVSDKMRSLIQAALIVSMASFSLPAAAETGDVPVHIGSVEIPVNKSQVVTADQPISRALIGNEDIADIFPVSNRSVYVLGKKMGTTSLTLYDQFNNVMAVMDIAVGPDVLGLREQMSTLIPDEEIDARISNESIVLSGMVSSAGASNRAVQLARAYAGDNVINLMTLGSSQQVMLEVRFAEVSRSVGKDVGFSTFFRNGNGNFSGAIGDGAQLIPDATTGAGILELDSITGSFGIFRRFFGDVAGLSVEAVLDALEDKGLSKTLAEPTLIALSGEKASFLAGGEFPIPVVQNNGGLGANGGNGVSGAVTVEFKPFGVSLAFTPTVLSDDTINLLVEPEVSSIDPTASIRLNGVSIPGVQTRRASTVLELRDGESFAIAGLLQQDFETTVRQVPILGSIPIIGTLFRSTEFQKGETELLIVVTPRLVAPIKPSQVRLPTDRIEDPIPAEVILNGVAYNPKTEAAQAAEAAAAAAADPASEGEDYEY